MTTYLIYSYKKGSAKIDILLLISYKMPKVIGKVFPNSEYEVIN